MLLAMFVFWVMPSPAQCSWEATFLNPYVSSPTPISVFVVGEHENFGDYYDVSILNTGEDTARGNIGFKVFLTDGNHQLEIVNNLIDLSRATDSGYLAPGEYIIYSGIFSVPTGYNLPCNLCSEIFDSATNETCHTVCLQLTDCIGERVITIEEDHRCQNQPYDFFGQPITQVGTYHHYDTTDNCILHYILYFTGGFYFPQPTITISGDTSFCEGGSTTLTAIADHSSYNNSGNFHLLWNNGVTTPNIHVTTSGVWSVTASYSYCTASQDITVTVLPNPEIQLSGDFQNCEGNPVELLVTTEEGAEITWSDGTTGNQFTTGQSGDYSVTVTGENGCVSSNTFEAVVGLPSQGDASLTAYYYYILNGTVCTQSGEYSYVIPNATGCDSVVHLHLTILWSWDAIVYSDTTCAGTKYTQHGLDTVFAHAGDYAIPLTATTALQLHVVESTPHILCSSEMAPCGNDTVILTVDKDAVSYQWNTSATTPSIMIRQSGYYAVTITNSYGCELASEYVHVGQSDLLPNSPEFCMGLVTSDGYHMMEWYKNNGNAVAYRIYRMTDNSGRYSVAGYYYPEDQPDHWAYIWDDTFINMNQHYTYRVCALDSCGRESEWSAPVAPMHLTLSTVYGSDTSLHLQWTPYIGTEVPCYRLYHNGTCVCTTSELFYDIHHLLPNNPFFGYYYVEAIVNPECSYRDYNGTTLVTYTQPRSNLVNFNALQITENGEAPLLVVFPNPTSDVLNIQISGLPFSSVTIEIYDMYGRLITQESHSGDLLQVDVSKYKAGGYIVRAFTKNAMIGYSKFVKR